MRKLFAALFLAAAPAAATAAEPAFSPVADPTGPQVVIECRVLTVPGGGKFDGWFGGGKPVASFTHDEVAALFREAQQCPTVSVLAAPKVTTFSGQAVNVSVGEDHAFVTGLDVRTRDGGLVAEPKREVVRTGTELRMTADVAACGKAVKLSFHGATTCLAGPPALLPVTHLVTPVFEGGSQGPPVPFTQFVQCPKVVTRTVERVATVADGGCVAVPGGRVTVSKPQPRATCAALDLLADVFDVDFRPEPEVRAVDEDVVYLVTVRLLPAVDDAEVAPMPRAVSAEPAPMPRCVAFGGCCELFTRLMAAEPAPLPAVTACAATMPACCGGASPAAGLVVEYRKACAAGRTEDAMKLAMRALAADPTCFAGGR